jgi:hypothetical protein
VIFDLGVGGVRLDRLDALLGVGLGLLPLAGGDDFAVRGFEVEPEFAGVILVSACPEPMFRR